jgi:hypothetical protein
MYLAAVEVEALRKKERQDETQFKPQFSKELNPLESKQVGL